MKKKVQILSGFVLGIVMWLVVINVATATQVDKITWCHVEPNGNQQTLHLPLAALQNAGHVNANGNPLHAGDHPGECVDPTATPTPTTRVEISPSPTEVPVTPSVTVTPEITITPTDTPVVTPTEELKQNSQSDGRTDGRSDGKSSCPECSQPKSSYDGSPVGWK